MLRVERVPPEGLDVVLAAAVLFDDPPDRESTTAFLAAEEHHLLLASVDGHPAGFVSAIELIHPDKRRPELFLYEIGVAPQYRQRGVGTALLTELVAIGMARGCGGMFVLTDPENVAAQRLYARAGGGLEAGQAMFSWSWDAPAA